MNLIQNVCKNILKSTSESQGHGKSIELNIQRCIFNLSDDIIKTYKQNDIHDIRDIHNKYSYCMNKNISIKTTTRNMIDCGDILRFLNSENTDMICIIMKQRDENIKEAKKTLYFNIDELLNKFWESLDISRDLYLLNIKDYVNHVKEIPKKTKTRDLKINKKLYETKMFKIRPKPSQNRVQCAINLNELSDLKSYKIFDGGTFFDKSYNKEIESCRRKRNYLKIKEQL